MRGHKLILVEIMLSTLVHLSLLTVSSTIFYPIPPSLSIVTIHTIRNFRVGSKDENPNKTVYEMNVGVIASSFWTRHLTLDRTMPFSSQVN